MTLYRVTKHASDGRPPYSYDARLVEHRGHWIIVEADWPLHEVVAGPISFKPGDRLIEFFSTQEHFNAFLIKRGSDCIAGWYCNITYPARIDNHRIHWHDLYLDIIIDAQGTVHIEDEDELEAAGIREADRELYDRIIEAKVEVLELIESAQFPFSYLER